MKEIRVGRVLMTSWTQYVLSKDNSKRYFTPTQEIITWPSNNILRNDVPYHNVLHALFRKHNNSVSLPPHTVYRKYPQQNCSVYPHLTYPTRNCVFTSFHLPSIIDSLVRKSNRINWIFESLCILLLLISFCFQRTQVEYHCFDQFCFFQMSKYTQ